jgi:hypothetical protein
MDVTTHIWKRGRGTGRAVLATKRRGGVMRKRRICYVGALGLALAVAVPATAMASATQNIEAGFSAQKNANIVFGQNANLSSKFSKSGTLRVNTFFSDIVGTPPALNTADIHLPEEMKFNTKGLDECNPADIAGLAAGDATAACKKPLVGTGLATLFNVGVQGQSLLFNGTKQNGNPTTLVHISVGAAPPVTLVGELRNSPLGSPYGQVLHVPVSETAGGPVPSGISVTRTELSQISKTFKDKKLLKKAKKAKKKGNTKKAKKLKKKAKKSYVSAKCDDGTLSYRADFIHAPPDPVQSPTYEQPCTS